MLYHGKRVLSPIIFYLSSRRLNLFPCAPRHLDALDDEGGFDFSVAQDFYPLTPSDFYQARHAQTFRVYGAARDFLEITYAYNACRRFLRLVFDSAEFRQALDEIPFCGTDAMPRS